ncbi:MAG TPA: phytoene/squalene synthase family protein [Blastocatellia bacterium]|nr:phytoene/squalene synthase family protein [Blastocatellia bacterium]
MAKTTTIKANTPWSDVDWTLREEQMRHRALQAGSESEAWKIITRQARTVLRTYSTSFFIVTRFLPPGKREQVEAIYAAVRYPDEIVDSFPLSPEKRSSRLSNWAVDYEIALTASSIQQALKLNVPCFLASFARVVRDAGIPPEHYRSFLTAMKLDVWPRRFSTLDDLIESYIYGSAVVVGYFLTYVYGSTTPQDFERALSSAKHLGIALQLTNFLRDVAEDQRRGRLYLPLDMLRGEGIIGDADATAPEQQAAFHRVLTTLTEIAEDHYARAYADLDAFAPDCRTAIHACIDVYRQLNQRIAVSPRGLQHRESVPTREKFKVLPTSKYWRLPLAYLTV